MQFQSKPQTFYRIAVASLAMMALTACSTVSSMSGPNSKHLPLMEYDYHDMANDAPPAAVFFLGS